MHRFIALLLAFIVVTPALARGQGPAQYSDLRDDAEKLVAEHSYAKAREIYLRAKTSAHPPSEERWIDFRLADTLWRSQAASPSADTTLLEAARAQLEGLIASVKRVEDRDRVWAESKESLADYWWVRRASRNWGAASPLYQEALDWWAGARDIELARSRYLSIVWRVAEPPQAEPYEYYGYYGNVLTMDVLENALRIATTEPDRARIHYYIAMTLERTGDESQIERVPDEFEAAISAGRSAAWYDDALYQYAQFLANSGRAVYSDDGNWTRQVDFPKALELYKRVVTEFHKGETRYYDEAVQAIDAITQPSVSVGVPSVFLPGSEVGYTLAWRNVSRIDLALYKLDLLKDTAFTKTKSDVNGWISEVQIAGRQPVRTWFRDTNDQADHKPGQEQLRIEGKALPMGAYLIEAKAGTLSQYRDLEAFAQFGSELDPETQKTLNRGERLVELLKQKEREPLEVADQVASIYAGTGGYLDRIKTERVREFLARPAIRLHSEQGDLLGRIDDGQLEEADEEALGKAIAEIVDDFGPDFDEDGAAARGGRVRP